MQKTAVLIAAGWRPEEPHALFSPACSRDPMKASASVFAASLVLLAACSSPQGARVAGPIVLGDSATIVTETDSQYLRDALPDFDPAPAVAAAPAPAETEKPAEPAADTVKEAPMAAPVAQQPAGAGLTVDFGTVTVFFPDLKVRNADRNVKGANGASYSSETPTIATKSLAVTGGDVKRVQQQLRYNAVAKQGGTTLVLTALGTENGPWQELKGSGGRYAIAAQPKLAFNPSPSAVRNAVQKAARAQRLSRKETQSFLDAVRNVRSVTQAPLAVALRTATWRIEGTDAKGKRFSKEVRVDLPL